MLAVGDLQLDDAPAGGRSDPLVALAQLPRADLTFANLEGPLTSQGRPTGLDEGGHPLAGARIRFAAPPERARWLTGRVDVVSLANNHALDQGDAGRRDTLAALTRAGVTAAWEAHPAELTRGSRRIEVVARAFAPDEPLDGAAANALVAEVERARAHGPVLVSLHWGKDSLLPSPAQRALAARLVAAGATAVLGHGSHWPTGIERAGSAVIAYSLGNFAFGCRCSDYVDAYALAFTIDAHGAATLVRAHLLAAGLAGAVPRSTRDPHFASQLEMLSRDLGSRTHRDHGAIVIE